MGVLPPNARVAAGHIKLDGTDLVSLSKRQRRALLWRDISFVPQSAMNSLDPVYRLRTQMREVLCGRGGLSRRDADAKAENLFAAVGLSVGRLADFPHQFSGGMRQRAAIALALALSPKLVVADEPVTALDVIVQRQVLDTLRDLSEQMNVATIMVTHDISVGRLSLQPGRGDVCRPHRGIRAGGRPADPAGAPLHDGTDERLPGSGWPDGHPGADRGQPARLACTTAGLPLRPRAAPSCCRSAPCRIRRPSPSPSATSPLATAPPEAPVLRDLARQGATWSH